MYEHSYNELRHPLVWADRQTVSGSSTAASATTPPPTTAAGMSNFSAGHPAGSSETFEVGHASLTANRLTPHWFKSRGRDLGWHWSSTCVRTPRRPPRAPSESTPRTGQRPEMVVEVLVAIVLVALIVVALRLRVVKQYERGLVFRFGRVRDRVRSPGLTMLVPVVDRMHKVSLQIVTMAVPAQDGITRDNVTVKVD